MAEAVSRKPVYIKIDRPSFHSGNRVIRSLAGPGRPFAFGSLLLALSFQPLDRRFLLIF